MPGGSATRRIRNEGHVPMAITGDVRSDTDHIRMLTALITERGIGRHGLFLLNSEGQVGPDSFEEMSGYVVTDTCEAFFFWTGWDEGQRRSRFKTWEPAKIQPDWHDDEEFQAALQAAGCA